MNNNIKSFVSTIAKPAVMSACMLAATVTQAGMSLVGDESNFSFITSKNSAVTEVHSFNTVIGEINDDGVATVSIDLASVDTAIAVRDERMQKFLFETTQFTKATFTADVADVLKKLKKDESVNTVVNGELSLHGESVPVSFEVLVVKSGGSVFVSTVKPVLIKASDFGLTAGVEKLRELAGLKSINPIVPASFVLKFK